MRKIGVRELKQTLSETLASVDRGESVQVTRHGRPMAEIVPTGSRTRGDDRLRRLIAAGRVTAPARGRPIDAPALVSPSRSASELVLAERELER